jgi:hypothetical protein
MHPVTILSRLVMFALTAAACLWLTSALGPWAAIPVWAAAITAACAAAAFMLHRQAPERITIINRIAGFFLPWGYAIGRGKLVPVVVESCLRWLLLGIAIVILAPQGLAIFNTTPPAPSAAYHPTPLMAGLLLLSWVTAAAILFRLLTFVITRSSPISAGTLPPIVALAGLLIASVMLTLLGRSAAMTWFALAMTAGPILLIGGGYGIVLLIMLTVGGKARWN